MSDTDSIDKILDIYHTSIDTAYEAYVKKGSTRKGYEYELELAKKEAREQIKKLLVESKIDEMKMMRELLHLFNLNAIDQMSGKTPANEYIKKRLSELIAQLNKSEGERK